MLFNLVLCAAVFVACGVAAMPAAAYSGYRVLLGPEEDENDPVKIRKKYKWKIKSPESFIIPVSAICGVLIFAFGTGLSSNNYTAPVIFETVLYCLAAVALTGLSYVDIRIFEIPPLYDIIIAALGVIRLLTDLDHFLDYLIGAVLVSGIFLLIAFFSKGRAMGGGDIKLMAALGLLVGWKKILLVMGLGAILGSVIHSIIMAVSKKEHVLAFGPYLSAGGILSMCFGDDLIRLYLAYLTSVSNS
jgi:leader peptidase (prepilin peptidase)/N-methyltransferase